MLDASSCIASEARSSGWKKLEEVESVLPVLSLKNLRIVGRSGYYQFRVDSELSISRSIIILWYSTKHRSSNPFAFSWEHLIDVQYGRRQHHHDQSSSPARRMCHVQVMSKC
jgi:hypothetical protein